MTTHNAIHDMYLRVSVESAVAAMTLSDFWMLRVDFAVMHGLPLAIAWVILIIVPQIAASADTHLSQLAVMSGLNLYCSQATMATGLPFEERYVVLVVRRIRPDRESGGQGRLIALPDDNAFVVRDVEAVAAREERIPRVDRHADRAPRGPPFRGSANHARDILDLERGENRRASGARSHGDAPGV
jgi:hypothetical protein